MELQQADKIAAAVIERLKPFCLVRADGYVYIEVAGSVRRRKPLCNDVDLVLIAADPWGLNAMLPTMGQVTMNGAKIQRVKTPAADIDIYIATPETWATLLLIRTGSKENNIRLCALAKKKGMQLHAGGRGLFRGVQQIAGDTEESIYQALGLKYVPPEGRN